jgi:hypothetical protein
MGPIVTLYILAGCVAAAAALFVVMLLVSVMRRPQLPSISTFTPPLQRMMRALTPLPLAPAGVAFDEAPTTAMSKTAPTMPAKPRYAAQMLAVQPAGPVQTRSPYAPTIAMQPAHTFEEPSVSSAAARSFPQALGAPARSSAPPQTGNLVAPAPWSAPRVAPPPLPQAARMIAPAPPVPGFAPSPFVWESPSPAPLATPLPTKGRADVRRAVSHPKFPTKKKRWWLRISLGLVVTSALAAGAAVAYPAMLDPICDDYEWFGNDVASLAREQAQIAHDTIADFIANL